MTTPAPMTLGGEGGTSFPFDKVGDFVTGSVLSMEQRQQTEMDGPNKGQPAFWPDGKPKVMYTVSLQTDLREDGFDDGVRTVHLKGALDPSKQSSLGVVRAAVKAVTGKVDLQYGGKLTLQFSNEEPSTQRGISPRKLYSAWYEVAPMGLGQPDAPPVAVPPTAAPPASPPVAPSSTSPAPSSVPVAAPPVSTPPAAGPPAATPPAVADDAAKFAAIEAQLTPEQKVDPVVRATLGLPPIVPTAPAAAWDSDPRVAQLRGMGIADDAIRSTLGL